MLEWIMPIMSVASGVMKMAGGQQGASAASNMGAINAAILEKQGQIARDRARISAMRIRREGQQVASRIIQSFGSSGVEANDGSALEVLGAHAAESEWRALSEEWAGDAEYAMAGYRASVARYTGQVQADQAMSRGMGGLIGGLMGAAPLLDKIDFGGVGGGSVGSSGVDESGWGMTDWSAAAAAFPGVA